MSCAILKNAELRKLPAGSLCNIAAILETNNDWKKVMSLIPRNPRSEYFEPKYNNEHIKQIEEHARTSNRKCAEILFEEWGTSGRIRPTLSTLKEVVLKAEIYRAADEIAQMLKEDLPQRPSEGPAAPIDTNITLLIEESDQINGSTAQMKPATKQELPKSHGKLTTAEMKSIGSLNVPDLSAMGIQTESVVAIQHMASGIDTDILRDEKLIHFEYEELERITKRFSERLIYTPDPVQATLAGKIGSGGFGEVFVGFHPVHGHLAVKKARSNLGSSRKPEIGTKVFNAEVRFLSQFRHKNIVPILGFSKDGPTLCIVCEYIDGGSLEQKIFAKILTEKQRINIMIGTAEGLRYLHRNEKPVIDDDNALQNNAESGTINTKKNNFVHGDVKTANILLTKDCVPKLCDFGLAKQYESTHIVTSMMGTSAYMAPEGFKGTITQKIDIYSYGIVLLELLTGLKPIINVNNSYTINIKDYVEECCPNNEINNLLDTFIDKWTKAKEIYTLARNCLEGERKLRPSSDEICNTLYKINGDKDA